MTDDDAARAAVVAERTDLAAMLGHLTEAQWGAPTLCAGWRVREVVAHMTMPFRLSLAAFLLAMARARGDFGRMADRQARADTARFGDAELLACLRDNIAHPWRPPGGGVLGALSHDVIHGLDVSVALGLDRRVPAERLAMVLSAMRPRAVAHFGVPLTGVRLEATDLDWSYGEGTPLRGAAQHLLLVVCGRRLPDGLLDGPSAARFTRV